MVRTVIANASFLARRKVTDLVIPWCTYTDPEVAHVGYYEKDAKAAGFDVATITEHFDQVDRAILDGETTRDWPESTTIRTAKSWAGPSSRATR